MSKSVTGKNAWALFLLILAGIVLGGFIGELTKDISGLNWLNYGQNFGILAITFGLTIKISISSIIGVFISVIIYRLL